MNILILPSLTVLTQIHCPTAPSVNSACTSTEMLTNLVIITNQIDTLKALLVLSHCCKIGKASFKASFKNFQHFLSMVENKIFYNKSIERKKYWLTTTRR